MLASAMDALLSPLYNPANVRFVPLRSFATIGGFTPPEGVLFPLDVSDKSSGGTLNSEDLAAGAMYVLCYRPLHRDASAFRALARAYVQTEAPDMGAGLIRGAREALAEGDWVGVVGRLWTAVQLNPLDPEPLDELAMACLHLGFGASAREDFSLAGRLARASGAALNTLAEHFPNYGPGHLHRAEFLAAAGDRAGAIKAVQEALRLGLTPDIAEDAYDLLRDVSRPAGHSVSEKP